MKKEKKKNTTFKEKIVIEKTNIEEIEKYNNNDDKKSKILLILIILLTTLDLMLYLTGSSFGILYIPIMCIVFVLLVLYNKLNSVFISIVDNNLIFFDNKEFSYILPINKIKEARERKSSIVIITRDDNTIEFKTLNKEIIFEKIKKGLLENEYNMDR